MKEQYFKYQLKWGGGPDPRKWGRTKEQTYDVNQPRLGRPAYVILNEPNALTRDSRNSGLKGMSENLFPPIVTATDGLAGVVLDHNPKWQQPRREAFIDWVHSGGAAHIIKNEEQQYPEFSGAMAELNSPLSARRVGQGMVFRHDVTRTRLTKEYVASDIRQPKTVSDELDEEVVVERGATEVFDENAEFSTMNLDDSLLATLKQMTQPDFNWVLIYFMSFVYLLMIFPGGYLLGRKRIDYRIMIASLLGTIARVSVGISIGGARGYDESTTVNTVAIARPLPDGYYNISTWTNAFVTSGGDYLIQQRGQGLLYSTCQSYEGVAGFISEDPAARFFAVDIPPYSARPFTSRVKAPGKPLAYKVVSFSGKQVLEKFAVSLSAEFENSMKDAYVIYDNRAYQLSRKQGEWVADLNGDPLISLLNISDFDMYGNQFLISPFADGNEDKTVEQLYEAMIPALLAKGLKLTDNESVKKFRVPTDRARLFLLTQLPPEFSLETESLGKQNGLVLYCLDVFKEP